ncbi:MAG TPA: hypothetical protein VFS62_13030 [Chloroflexota bacterium]|nr:hypothetical protein [Chloroflexota bacterium]
MDTMRQGWDVLDEHGHKIGIVAEIHRDYVLVREGKLFKKDVRLPSAAVLRTDAGKHCVQLGASA